MKVKHTIYRSLLIPTLLMAFLGPASLWSTPYMVYANGGGMFLISLVLLLIFFGAPMFISEFLMGTWMKGPIKMFRTIPILQGLSFGSIAIGLITLPYYTVYASYSVVYLRTSLLKFEDAFMKCSSTYNTPHCEPSSYGHMFVPGNGSDGSVRKSPSLEYFEATIGENTYKDSDHPALTQETGFNTGVAFGLFIFCVALIPFYIMVPASLGILSAISFIICSVFLIILLIRGCSLPGSLNGMSYAFHPNPNMFVNSVFGKDVITSIINNFGFGLGVIPTLTHYGKPRYKFWGIDIGVVLFLYFMFIIGHTCLVFSYMGFLSYTINFDINHVVRSGPQLVFVQMPAAFAHLPGGSYYAALFFAYLFLLGLTTVVTLVETVSNCCIVLLQAASHRFSSRHKTKLRMSFGLAVIVYTLLFGLGYCNYDTGPLHLMIVDWEHARLLPLFMVLQLIVGALFLLLGALKYATPLRLSKTFKIVTIIWAAVMLLLALGCFVHFVVSSIEAIFYTEPTILGIIVAIFPLIAVIVASVVVLVLILRRRRQSGEGKLDGVVLPSLATKMELYGWPADNVDNPEMTALHRAPDKSLYPVEILG